MVSLRTGAKSDLPSPITPGSSQNITKNSGTLLASGTTSYEVRTINQDNGLVTGFNLSGCVSPVSPLDVS